MRNPCLVQSQIKGGRAEVEERLVKGARAVQVGGGCRGTWHVKGLGSPLLQGQPLRVWEEASLSLLDQGRALPSLWDLKA